MTRDERRQKSRPPRALRAALGGRGRGVERPVEVGAVARARSPARNAPALGVPGQPLGRKRPRSRGVPLPRGAARASRAGGARGPRERVRGDRGRSLAAGARAIVAIAAGLGESSADGSRREQAVVERVRAAGAVLVGPNCMGLYDGQAELDLASSDFVPGPSRPHLAERQPGDRGRAARQGARPRHLPLRLDRQSGRPRSGGARRGARGARAHARDRRLPRGLPRRSPVRSRGCRGRQAGGAARGRDERGRSPRCPLAHRSTRQRVGCDRRGLPGRRHRSRLDSTRAGRGRAAAARARSAAGTAGCDRHRRRRLGGRRGGSRERRRARAPARSRTGLSARLAAAMPADGDDEQPRRLRRRRRAGPQLVRTRAAAAARVGRGRRGAADRLSRRLQRNLRGAPRPGDRGRPRSRSRSERQRPHRARPDDVLAGGARAGSARGRRARLPRHRRGHLGTVDGCGTARGDRRPAATGARPSRGPVPATSRRAACWPRPASTFRDPCKRRPPRRRSQPRPSSGTRWC